MREGSSANRKPSTNYHSGGDIASDAVDSARKPNSYHSGGDVTSDALGSNRKPSASSYHKSKIYQTIAQARASLAEPSRPFTPAEPSRHLFRPSASTETSYASSRPSSAFKIGASNFVVGGAGASLRPSAVGDAEVLSLSADGAEAPQQPVEQQHWWEDVEEQLHELRPGAPADSICAACDALWELLKPPNGAAGPPNAAPIAAAEVSRRQKRVVATVGALMERKESSVLLRLCRLILVAAGDNASPQAGACKLAFKLSKAVSKDGLGLNDHAFRELGLLPLLLALVQGAPYQQAPKAGATSGGEWKPSALSAGVESALYAAGALKNVSADAANQRVLLQLGAVGTFASVLRAQMAALGPSVAAAVPTTPRGSSAAAVGGGGDGAAVRPVHLLVQVSATLRNLAVSGSSRKQFVSTGCVEELCGLLARTPQHAELAMNVCRVLAKLSLHEDVRRRMDADPRAVEGLLRVLQLHHADRPLLIRACFILGNLSANNERNREMMAAAALPLLLQLLCTHAAAVTAASPPSSTKETKENCAPPAAAARPPTRVDSATSTHDPEGECAPQRPAGAPPPPPTAAGDDGTAAAKEMVAAAGGVGGKEGGAAAKGASDDKEEEERQAERFDVLVKLIRLLAHLAISRPIGEQVAAAAELDALLGLLERFASEPQHEELLLNATSAITNVTFYIPPDDAPCSHALLAHPARLVAALQPVLTQPNEEGIVEASRALGNLSRRADVRRALCAGAGHEALLRLLDHTAPPVRPRPRPHRTHGRRIRPHDRHLDPTAAI